ncbi:unnamed protein product [Closterium sp. Naga37s-1]|nr:unnamed protein product [Closterium sp. Naga37s-1]
MLDPGLTPEGPHRLRGEGRHLLQPFRLVEWGGCYVHLGQFAPLGSETTAAELPIYPNYVHLGQFAPLGSETTAAELPGDWVSIGRCTQWLWYSVYARWVCCAVWGHACALIGGPRSGSGTACTPGGCADDDV